MIKSEDKRQISDIISIDPSTLHSYSYAKNEIKLHKLEKSSKNSFFISYIQTRDLIQSVIDISRNIPESDLKDAIEIKVYDELALDSSIEYAIHYTETESKDTKLRTYNVFVVDTTLLDTKLAALREKTKYIDFLSTPPFLVKALYQKNLIEPVGTHCFVYFQKTDAFLAIYKNGEYLYSKSLHYSLKEINEKFCELLGERVDEEEFYKILINEGLRTTKNDYQQHLMKLFGEIFLYVNDVLIFAKRSYGIDTIHRTYIWSEIGVFSGIKEYGQSYLGLESHAFNFSIAINSKEWYIDQVHILMMLSAQVHFENPFEGINFSLHKRPPPFKQRASGKLASVVGLGILIGLAFPLYQIGYDTYLSILLSQNNDQYNELIRKTSHIRQVLSALKVEKEKVNALVDAETTKFEFRKKLLNEIYNKKISYPMKAQILSEVFELSNQSFSKISSVNFTQKSFDFLIHNKDDKRITEFISELTRLEKYKINTDKISKNETGHSYVSRISVGLKHE